MYNMLKRLIASSLQPKTDGKKSKAIRCKNTDNYYGDKICASVEQHGGQRR